MSQSVVIRSGTVRVRAPRVPVGLQVMSKTIGTDAAYSLSTVDVSRSGMLLNWQRRQRVPFIVNTILELTIDPQGQILGDPLTCLGKVVRRDRAATAEAGEVEGAIELAIQIVQIDPQDLDQWESCLTELERKYNIELSKRIYNNSGGGLPPVPAA